MCCTVGELVQVIDSVMTLFSVTPHSNFCHPALDAGSIPSAGMDPGSGSGMTLEGPGMTIEGLG